MKSIAEGDTNPLAGADEGDRVRITNARVVTDRDGVAQLEVSGVCDVEMLPSASADQISVVDSAADGGAEQADTDDKPDT